MRIQNVALTILILFITSCMPIKTERGPAITPFTEIKTERVPTLTPFIEIKPERGLTLTPTEVKFTPSPIVEPTQEYVPGELDLSYMRASEWAFTSRSGEWVATGLVAFPRWNQITVQMSYARVIVFNTETNAKWTVLERWEEIGVGSRSPRPLDWSADEDYFYFTSSQSGDGCRTFAYLAGVSRVDLDSGLVEELLDPISSWVALSPDQLSLAYTGYTSERSEWRFQLKIRNLITSEEKEVTIDPGIDSQVGGILWSPDGKFVAVTLAIEPCGDGFGESSTILLVDTETMEVTVLLEEDDRLFVTYEWNDPEEIVLSYGYGPQGGLPWMLDISSGEISN